MNTKIDVAIVGGGVMGCSVAYHLKKLDPGLAVTVIERDPSYRTASSALSASSIRQQFSVPINVKLSQYSFDFFRSIGQHLGVDGEAVSIDLVEQGYLYLVPAAGVENLRSSQRVQAECGARTALLSPAELAERFPWLSAEGVELACLGLAGEGWFDGYSLLQAFRRKARALGVEFRTGEVSGLEFAGAGAALQLSDGTRLACATVVNAAGPQAAQVARMAGLEIPVAPERHCIYVFECPTPIPQCPLVVDPSGLYFRHEGSRYIVGPPPDPNSPPVREHLEVDHQVFDDFIWPTLAARVPAFEAIRCVSAWAGFYEMNTFDHNALIGKAPGFDHFMLINGFSGHGIQQSPAAGLALAELILFGRFITLDATPLDPRRVFENRPLRELNVI
ncbi:NAD(P)/FAD-dependent oxidoreductase [Roseateles violae]|uniref:FAD-binding oxidoreductase n=1 Tax=Roseateles violae TaxID=3058042 RepID=A0ABT8DXN4_9BURK|nr:FAD-binding oxidoreductase [Pelomonas sp. PFR6]MDN3921481.1 FAD-binding oxidoreductase [Pelomonas sp. PFR6]